MSPIHRALDSCVRDQSSTYLPLVVYTALTLVLIVVPRLGSGSSSNMSSGEVEATFGAGVLIGGICAAFVLGFLIPIMSAWSLGKRTVVQEVSSMSIS
jgi:hypothetical protein